MCICVYYLHVRIDNGRPSFSLPILGKSAISPIYIILSVSQCVCVCVCVCPSVYLCDTIVRTDRNLARIKNVNNDVYKFRHLPSNDATAKVVLGDLLFSRLHF